MSKILAILFWLCSICQIWRLHSESNTRFYEQSVPMILFTAILFFYWGRILWKGDERKVAINGFLMTLMIVGIFIAEFVVCVLIGDSVAAFMANHNPVVANWVFAILMTICLYNFAPSNILPKRFFVVDEPTLPTHPTSDEGSKSITVDQKESQNEENTPNTNYP